MTPLRSAALPRGPAREPASARSRVAVGAAYVLAYVALDWVSYVHPIGHLGITPWNPPPGLTLFLLLRYGLSYAPLAFVAAVIAELVVRGVPSHWLLTIASAFLVASCYVAAGTLLARRFGLRRDLRGASDAHALIATAVVAPLVLGVVYVGLHVAVGELAPQDVARATVQFWIGDAIGIVVTTPLLLEYAERPVRLHRRIDVELLLQVATVLAALWLVFGVSATDEFKFFYLLFLPPLWIALRRGLRGATVASLAIQLGLITAGDRIVAKGYAVWELQFLMLTLALTMLYLGLAVSERAAAQRTVAAREAALNRALRMATAGEMAATIAHEVNQPLSAIGTYARACVAMLDQPGSGPRLRDTLERMSKEVARAGAVIHRLRDFYRTGSTRRERVDPAELVRAAVDTVRTRLAAGGIEIDVGYAPGLPAIEVDKIQIEAVLHNLLANAIDALGELDQEPRRIAIHASATAESMVRYSIADSGRGIPPERAAVLFQPFESTKPEGMGLGLAMSRSIVEAHGGRLVHAASPLGGAAFEVFIPVAPDELRRGF